MTGRTPGRETVRRLTKALGYTWKKAKKLLGKACPLKRAHFVEQLGELLVQARQPDLGEHPKPASDRHLKTGQ